MRIIHTCRTQCTVTVVHEDVGGHRSSMQATFALDYRGNNYSKVLDTGRVSARHYSPDSNIACRFASDVL